MAPAAFTHYRSKAAGVRKLAWLAAAFALLVIVFGAFVRLSNAGLSCPDWPTCYGQATWPTQPHEIAAANAAFPERTVDADKAWREQAHRLLVGGLALLTLWLACLAWWRRRELGALTGVPLCAVVLIIFQAALGMWTVTLKLLPLVVCAHLIGGMTLFAMLAYTALRLSISTGVGARRSALRTFSTLAIAVLAIQIAFGGWTSANYAALACGTDFPTCSGSWWPTMDFHQAFVLWRGVGVDYEGGVLDAPARTAIQFVHRCGAVAVSLIVIGIAVAGARRRDTRAYALAVLAALILQLVLGVSNVQLGLPLGVATAHNGGAAVLLFALLALRVRLRVDPRAWGRW